MSLLGHWGLALSYASYYAAFAWARCRFVNGQVPYFFLDYSLPTKRAYAFHLGLAAILTVYFLGFSIVLERMASLGVPWRFAVHAAVCYSNMRLRAPKAYLEIEKKREAKSS